MTTLKFRSKEFTRMINWMIPRERKIPYVNEDEGIYVMAPTWEKDIVSNDKCHVIYARGYSPRVKDLWEKTHAVSGDDFAEFIPLSEEQMKRVALFGELDIRLTETEVSVYA